MYKILKTFRSGLNSTEFNLNAINTYKFFDIKIKNPYYIECIDNNLIIKNEMSGDTIIYSPQVGEHFDFDISSNGKSYIIARKGKIQVFDINNNLQKEFESEANSDFQINYVYYTPDNMNIIYQSSVESWHGNFDDKESNPKTPSYCILLNLKLGQSKFKIESSVWLYGLFISPNGKYFITSPSYWRSGNSSFYNLNTGELLFTAPFYSTSYDFSKDENIVLVTTDNEVFLFDISQRKKIKTIQFPSSGWHRGSFFNGEKNILVFDGEQYHIYETATGNKILSVVISDENSFLAMTPDGYWESSANNNKLVHIVDGIKSYSLDQFAARNNRPDIIMQRMGIDKPELIKQYHAQYLKRLRKLGLTEEQLTKDLHVPTSTITSEVQQDKFVNLSFSLNDTKYSLNSYNIFINDVPLFGSYGKKVQAQQPNTKEVKVAEKIELIAGSNKIEVSCTNDKGVESYRTVTYANYTKPVISNLYVLAFGVSKYKNPNLNLNYADKDALDIEKTLKRFKGQGYENIYTKVLTNEQVTPESIKASKDFLNNAKVDDTFILFIAGHGMHDNDNEATYYYLTYNADLANLKNTAADFETIEDLLQGIPPRNKLFLMDACESGELDNDDNGQVLAVAKGSGLASRGFKSTVVQSNTNNTNPVKRQISIPQNRYLYNDLVRRSGAIVFSSSKGGEFSYERSDIKNGLFTKSIITALTSNVADKDGNGFVSTDELREFVTKDVAKTSGNMQHPTVDRDNIYQKFGFKIK